ncbi:PDZ domain-containing protein [Streptomyces spiramenti]|uniref:endopeptidase La n=1 Tax=Streptomyces spiramenti TaxID=2720606 RepID=A0ABX1ASE6_9ACTN|nr:PDZ domain-containing protein [Streptomyces spiramenti]NJP68719.1 PDZ domain-containing protein [Streptomyces spiramenti]
MPRRIATLLTSGLLLLGLLFAALLVKVPYAQMSPGPTVNTLGEHNGVPVLDIKGTETYETTGHLNMTTVRVTGVNYRMSIADAMRGWLSPRAGVVPYETLYPDDRTADEVDQENAEEFSRSQESAKAVALRELGYELESETIVDSVVRGGPAEGELRAGDVILEVDGEPIDEPARVAEVVTRHEADEKVVFTVRRPVERDTEDDAGAAAASDTDDAAEADADDEVVDVTVTTAAAEDDGRAIVGIQAGTAYVFPFEIDIELADVGGPSAGLMFSLGIIDKLTPEELTGGTFVAGTGTIAEDGRVGPIGGVVMKTIAARDQGAEYFLTPEANCRSLRGSAPDDLTLVAVGTLDDALTALEHIRADEPGELTTCED